mmetsp:Transcript_98405/g.195129  ORF Transcript_98405/g.195129 Transcript_98405/m.195129 type:complete len:125 (-) Transcript_98405:61-435(-)
MVLTNGVRMVPKAQEACKTCNGRILHPCSTRGRLEAMDTQLNLPRGKREGLCRAWVRCTQDNLRCRGSFPRKGKGSRRHSQEGLKRLASRSTQALRCHQGLMQAWLLDPCKCPGPCESMAAGPP